MRSFVMAVAATIFIAQSVCLMAAETSPPLRADEIPVEVVATGVSVLPADKATVTLNLRKTRATNREARDNVRRLADQLTAELVQLGLSRQSINFEEPTNRPGFIGNEAVSEMMEGMGQATSARKTPASANASLELTISEMGLLPRLRDLIDQRDAVVMENPAFSLSDDRRARNAAIHDGTGKARLDADAYASALGMRVRRVVRAKDQAAQPSLLFPDYDKMVDKFIGQSDVKAGMVKTSVRVIVEFALAPR